MLKNKSPTQNAVLLKHIALILRGYSSADFWKFLKSAEVFLSIRADEVSKTHGFRVRCSIWNIVEVGILSTEPGGTFDSTENDLSKESKARKPTICKGFSAFFDLAEIFAE